LDEVTTTNAGYSFSPSKYCQDVVINAGGTITAQTLDTGGEVEFTLEPTDASGRLEWTCTSNATKPSWIAAECRGS
jgi:hypothetical protein